MSLPVRVTNAIRGAFVGDAAAMGTHWIYDPAEMAKAVPSVDAPEFKDPPTPSFYSSKEFPGHYEKGMLSPYGAQLMFATKYTATVSEVAGDSMSTAMLEWANTFGGRPDHATKTFVENMGKDDGKWPNCGADDNQGTTMYGTAQPSTQLTLPTSSLLHEGGSRYLPLRWQV